MHQQRSDSTYRSGNCAARSHLTGDLESELPQANGHLHGFRCSVFHNRVGILNRFCPSGDAHFPALCRRSRRRRAGLSCHRSSPQLAGRSQYRALYRRGHGRCRDSVVGREQISEICSYLGGVLVYSDCRQPLGLAIRYCLCERRVSGRFLGGVRTLECHLARGGRPPGRCQSDRHRCRCLHLPDEC